MADIQYLRHKGEIDGLIGMFEPELEYNIELSKIDNFKGRMEYMLDINEKFLKNEYNEKLQILSFIIRVQELILKNDTTPEEKQELRERLKALVPFYRPRLQLWLNGHAITNIKKIKDGVTAEQIRDVFIKNEASGYQEILNMFKAKSKSKSVKKVQKKSKSLKKVQKKSKSKSH